MDKPTIYLSNWSSARSEGHHGPGRAFSIMARPRAWERGQGRVWKLTPGEWCVRDVKAGRMSREDYRRLYEGSVEQWLKIGLLLPGVLEAQKGEVTSDDITPVRSGDTLCCACSREKAGEGGCHRAWAAPFLMRAGWRVVLDGVEQGVEEGQKKEGKQAELWPQ